MIFFTIVVFPALSSPLMQSAFIVANKLQSTHSMSILISLSFSLAFRKIESILLLELPTLLLLCFC